MSRFLFVSRSQRRLHRIYSRANTNQATLIIFQHIFPSGLQIPHAANGPQSQQSRRAAAAARLLDLQDLGDVLPHLHAAALWIKKKKKGCTLKKKTLLVLQWIAKAPSCGSELVFLDLYPESPAANQSRKRERRASLCRLTPAEGGVLKSGGGCECVSVCGSCAGWSLGCFLGSHTLRRDHLWAKTHRDAAMIIAHFEQSVQNTPHVLMLSQHSHVPPHAQKRK